MEVSRQLAANLPGDAVKNPLPGGADQVFKADGDPSRKGDFAGDGSHRAGFRTMPPNQKAYTSTAHLHFGAWSSDLAPPHRLNTLPDGLVNSVVVMSQVAGYAPEGQHLISVSIVGKRRRKAAKCWRK